jgi:hypothetical protein
MQWLTSLASRSSVILTAHFSTRAGGSLARCGPKGPGETVAESPPPEYLAQPKPIERDSQEQTNQSKQIGNGRRINLLDISKPFLDNLHSWNNCHIFCQGWIDV